MSMIVFTANQTDHSNDTGYQFEFHCDKCGNGFMSQFQANKISVAGGFFRAAAGLFNSSTMDRIAGAGDHVKDSLRGGARDKAFAAAVEEGKTHFHQCKHCGKWVCPENCWNLERGLCKNCAPDLMEEAAAAQASAAKEQVWEKAKMTDQTGGLDMAGKVQVAYCPHCGAKSTGGKFCGDCGKPLAAKTECPSCKAKLPEGAKFCGECGGKV